MKVSSIATIFPTLIFGLIGGLVASTGSILLVGATLGLGIALFLLFSPKSLMVATMVFSLAIAGVAEFYWGIGQANWIPSLLGLALFPAAFIAKRTKTNRSNKKGLDSVTLLVGTFVFLLLAASALNLNSQLQFITGIRNYLPFIGVFIALQMMPVSDEDLKKWLKILLFLGLVQFPFCLQQALFVAPKRAQSFGAVGGGAEAIVGSFGGNPLGGGYTGEMAVFVLVMSLLALAIAPALKNGRVIAFFMCTLAIGCVALAETKIVFVLAPIAVLIMFFEDIRHSPKRMISVLLTMGLALGGLAAVYAWRFWSKGPDEFWHAFTYSFDPNFMVDALHRGRVAALFHWWATNPGDFDILHSFFGYGMASTLEASRVLGEGSAVKLFGFGLDAHAASKLLWDSGVLGLGVFCWLIVRSGWNAHRLANLSTVPEFHRNALKATRAIMFCFAAMLPYQVSVVGGAPMQFLFWFFVGYIEYWRTYVKRAAS